VTAKEEPHPHVEVSVVVFRALNVDATQAAHVIFAFPFARLRPDNWLQFPKAKVPEPSME
jgi:hypothetical protein